MGSNPIAKRAAVFGLLALAIVILVFSIKTSTTPPEMPKVEAGPNARTEDEPERIGDGITHLPDLPKR